MTTQFIDDVAVEIDGDEQGPTVLCIHGLGGTSNSWGPILPALAGFRVIRIDLPGSGRSSDAEGALSVQRFVDTITTVCARLKTGRMHLLGHSLGTIVAQHFAVQHQAMVEDMVLFGPLLCPPDAGRQALRERADKTVSSGPISLQEVANEVVQRTTSADTKVSSPTVLAFVRESVMRQAPDGYARMCFALAEATAAEIERIDVPVLLITGDEDVVGPPAGAKAMAGRLPNAQFEILHGCGHWPTLERPAECIRLLQNFLSRQ